MKAEPARMSVEDIQNDTLSADSSGTPSEADVEQDIDVILWSVRLASIRRYFHQPFWKDESTDAEYANRVESYPRLESVAEHSWHVADIVLLLAPHFPAVNISRCAQLAILHDKLEIITGDLSPVDRSGTGASTHAFNEQKQVVKLMSEEEALELYLRRLRPSARELQRNALLEILAGTTLEARFVKAVDKLQALGFILLKKDGDFKDKHLTFSLRYAQKITLIFPPLRPYYEGLRRRLIGSVAERRGVGIDEIESLLGQQPVLPFDR